MTALALLAMSLENADDLDIDDSSIEADDELNDAEMEMEAAASEQDDLEASEEAMGEIEEELTQEAANGGISAEAAKWLKIACKAAMGPHTTLVVGERTFEVNKSPVMSLESFGDTDTTARATQMTLEGIGDTIKKIWQAIKNAVVRVINSVREFFAKIFIRTKGLKTQLEEVRKAISSSKNSDYGKGKFKIPGIVSRIHSGGSVEPKAIAKSFKMMADAGGDMYDKYMDSVKIYYGLLATKLKNIKGGILEDGSIVDLNDQLYKMSGHLTAIQSKYKTELPGGKRLVYTKSSSEEKGAKIGRLSVERMGKDFRTGDEGQEGSIPTLDSLKSILDSIEKFIKVVDGKKSDFESLNKERLTVIAASDDWLKDADQNWFKEKWTQAKVRVVLGYVHLNLMQSLTSYTSYSFKVARAGLIYAKAAVAAA